MYTLGIDVGSASSKVVILKDGKDVVAAEVVQVGTGSSGPKKALEQAYQVSGLKPEEIAHIRQIVEDLRAREASRWEIPTGILQIVKNVHIPSLAFPGVLW